jgi:chromosome segregation ATPase
MATSVQPSLLTTPQNQLILEDKSLKKADKCLKAMQGTSIGLSTLGAITTIAIAIILATAPLLIPAIAFKALLIVGSALLIFGTALAIAAIAKSLKGTIAPKHEQLHNELLESRNLQTALLGQLQDSEAQFNRVGTEKQEIERKLQGIEEQLEAKVQELVTAQNKMNTLENIKDPEGLRVALADQEGLGLELQHRLENMSVERDHFENDNKKLVKDSKIQKFDNDRIIRDLKDEIGKLGKQIQGLGHEKDQLVFDYKKLNTDHSMLRKSSEELKENNVTLNSQINKKKKDIDGLKNALKAQNEVSDGLNAELSKLQGTYKDLKEEYVKQLDTAKDEISNLERKITELKNELDESIEDKKQAMAQFRETGNADISTLALKHQEKVVQLKGEALLAKQQLDEANLKIPALELQLSVANKDLEAKEKALTNIQEQLKTLEQAKNEAESKLLIAQDQSGKKYALLANDYKQLESEYSELENADQVLKDQNKLLNSMISQRREDIKALRIELKNKTKLFDEANQVILQTKEAADPLLQEQLKTLEQAKYEAEGKLLIAQEEWNKEKAAFTRENDHLNEEYEKLENEKKDAALASDQKMQKLKDDIQSMKETMVEKIQLERLRARAGRQKEAIIELNSQVDTLTNELETLKNPNKQPEKPVSLTRRFRTGDEEDNT